MKRGTIFHNRLRRMYINIEWVKVFLSQITLLIFQIECENLERNIYFLHFSE